MSEELPNVIYVSKHTQSSRKYHLTDHVNTPFTEKIADPSSIRTLINILGYTPCEICKNKKKNEEFQAELKPFLDDLETLTTPPENTTLRVYKRTTDRFGDVRLSKVWEQVW